MASKRILSPAKQLDQFLSKYSPAMRTTAKAALAKMRARLPGSVELVYDNYNWLVIGFGPTERASDAVFSLALAPEWVTLCFLRNGPKLPDPHGLLRGSGSRVRNIRLMGGAGDLDKIAIKSLMQSAVEIAGNPFDKNAPRAIVIRSISEKQRPRRRAA